MRSYNDIDTIEETMRMIQAQTVQDFELISLDNHSTDGTAEVIGKYMRHGKFLERSRGPYSPGAVLNQGVDGSTGDYLVFLNSDASPMDEHWLAELVKPLENPDVGAVYGRQEPRPDAHSLVRKDYEYAFPPESECERQVKVGGSGWAGFFSMANSASRRDVVDKIRFPNVVHYPEDILWSKRVREAGYKVVYAPKSRTRHSHNYTFRQAWRRFRWEGVGDGEIFERRAMRDNLFSYAVAPYLSSVAKDLVYQAKHGQLSLGEIKYSVVTRFAQKFGRYAGMREGRALKAKRRREGLPQEAAA